MGLTGDGHILGREVAAADRTFCAGAVELGNGGACRGQLCTDQGEFGAVVVGSAGCGGFVVAESAAELCQAD
jgi:hypothetical protein